VSLRANPDLAYQGITQFLDYDLLRYGYFGNRKSRFQGFAVVERSDAIETYIRSEILPNDFVSAVVLMLLAENCAIVDAGTWHGEPDFVFRKIRNALTKVARILYDFEGGLTSNDRLFQAPSD
jgi:hypothetical protein